MADDTDENPFSGIGEKDRIRKPTRLTWAQIGIMATAVGIVIVSLAVGVGLVAVYDRKNKGMAVMAAGIGLGCAVYRIHWRYRQRDLYELRKNTAPSLLRGIVNSCG